MFSISLRKHTGEKQAKQRENVNYLCSRHHFVVGLCNVCVSTELQKDAFKPSMSTCIFKGLFSKKKQFSADKQFFGYTTVKALRNALQSALPIYNHNILFKTDGKRAACNYRVMDARGRSLSTNEAGFLTQA